MGREGPDQTALMQSDLSCGMVNSPIQSLLISWRSKFELRSKFKVPVQSRTSQALAACVALLMKFMVEDMCCESIKIQDLNKEIDLLFFCFVFCGGAGQNSMGFYL